MSRFRVCPNDHAERTGIQKRSSGRRRCACATATISSVLVVVAIFGFTAFNLQRNQFTVNRFQVHSGDEVAVSRLADDLSETFCNGYEIEMKDRGEAYLLPSRAKTVTSCHEVEYFQIRSVLGKVSLDTRGFYLLKNSSIETTGCRTAAERAADVTAEMILCKGDLNSHHNRHHRHKRNRNNEIKRVQIPESATCNESFSSLPKLEYTVTQEGVYYVTLAEKRFHSPSSRYSDDEIILNGTLTRTFYDVTNPKSTCEDRFLCYFSLDFDDDDDVDVVIRIPNNPVTPLAKSSFRTHCYPRLAFWVGLFVGVPVVLTAVLIAFWIWMFYVRAPAYEVSLRKCHRPRSSTVTSVSGSASPNERAKVIGKERSMTVYYKSVQET